MIVRQSWGTSNPNHPLPLLIHLPTSDAAVHKYSKLYRVKVVEVELMLLHQIQTRRKNHVDAPW
jgi:hypothetical protein